MSQCPKYNSTHPPQLVELVSPLGGVASSRVLNMLLGIVADERGIPDPLD